MPNPWSDPRPFALGPADAHTAFVLLHGFTGAPAEMRPLGEELAQRGYRAIGVQLPGHGTTPEALYGVRWEDWADVAQAHIDWAHESAERVVLAGLSMGGLLAAVLVGERKVDVDAAVLLAPAFKVRDPLFALIGVGRFLLPSIPAPALPRGGLTSIDGWKRLWHYDRRPTEAIWQLRRLQTRAWHVLEQIAIPTLIVQGRRDLTLDPSGTERAAAKIGAELLWLARSGHCLTADVELPEVVERIEALLARLES